jgi:CheY-like chemotaxis protein
VAKEQSPTVPPGSDSTGVTLLDEPFEMPERAFFEQLDERARRAELLTAHLRAGGLAPASAVLALQATLGAISGSAQDAKLRSLADLASALRSAIGYLGIGAPMLDDVRVVDTLVFDEAELSRDLVALSVEAHGHTVRCAATYDDFVKQLDQRKPGLVITEIEWSNAPAKSFCPILAELLSGGESPIPFVFFSTLQGSELAALAKQHGARRGISKDAGIDVLIGQLREVYSEVLDIRATGGRPRFRLPSDPGG